MKDYFGKTREEFQAWLRKHADKDEPTGILAISPALYRWFQEATGRPPTADDGAEVLRLVSSEEMEEMHEGLLRAAEARERLPSVDWDHVNKLVSEALKKDDLPK